MPGGSEHSFGIQVAKMAGMPPALIVLNKAKKFLHELEESQRKGSAKPDTSAISNDLQLSFFQLDDPVSISN